MQKNKKADKGLQITFPDPRLARRDGLLALGGNLEPETLISAYSSGIFPWSVNPITWWSLDPRAIFELDKFNLSRRMQRFYRNCNFKYTTDKDFVGVMCNCSNPASGREDTWISPKFIDAYTNLHKLGVAHSVEVWLDKELVGGVYGVAIGGFFAGESMFSNVPNASTMGLNVLFQHLKARGFLLFDTQHVTPHTARLGAIEISRKEYLKKLHVAIHSNCSF